MAKCELIVHDVNSEHRPINNFGGLHLLMWTGNTTHALQTCSTVTLPNFMSGLIFLLRGRLRISYAMYESTLDRRSWGGGCKSHEKKDGGCKARRATGPPVQASVGTGTSPPVLLASAGSACTLFVLGHRRGKRSLAILR